MDSRKSVESRSPRSRSGRRAGRVRCSSLRRFSRNELVHFQPDRGGLAPGLGRYGRSLHGFSRPMDGRSDDFLARMRQRLPSRSSANGFSRHHNGSIRLGLGELVRRWENLVVALEARLSPQEHVSPGSRRLDRNREFTPADGSLCGRIERKVRNRFPFAPVTGRAPTSSAARGQRDLESLAYSFPPCSVPD